jgi:hypothetical protein
MPGLTVRLIHGDITQFEAEALIVGFYEDVRPLKGLAGELDWLLCGALSNLVLGNKLRGSLGETALLTSQGKVRPPKIFLIGLGFRADTTLSSLKNAARNAAASALGAGVGNAAIEYFQSPGISHDSAVAALYQGLKEGAGGRVLDVQLLAAEDGAYEHILRFLKA